MYARIIRVAEVYDELTNSFNANVLNKEEVLQEIKIKSGKILDPFIVDIFNNTIKD